MIKVSFIVPCFNARKTLYKCLNSLTGQSLAEEQFEIIVVDNNSQDNPQDILELFPNAIIINESRQGRSFARNRGAHESRGEFLAFIDADVYLASDWAEKLLELFSNDCNMGAGQGQIIPCQLEGSTSLNRFRYRCVEEETEGSFILTELLRYEFPMINTAACMYRKSAFIAIDGFDPLLERHEDIDLSRRIHMSGYDIHCSTEARAHVIFHGESWYDFIKRSFDDGYYKKDYLVKWKDQPLTLSCKVPPRSTDFMWWFISQVRTSFQKRSFHYLVALLINTINAYGRFCGRVRHVDKSTKLPKSPSPELFGKVIIDKENQNV